MYELIQVKFLGGAKKSFSTDTITINHHSDMTIQDLLDYLTKNKPLNTPKFDVNNILVAVNGVDSSAIQGKLTKLQTNDVISIIPIIHGGSNRRVKFVISQSAVELMEIKKDKKLDDHFLDGLRNKFSKLTIQGVSIGYVLSSSHAKKILSISFAAEKNHTLLSKKLETDILMRFACTSQITEAIKMAGIKPGSNFLIIAIGSRPLLDKLHLYLKPFLNSKTISQNNHTFLKKRFKISKKQMNAIKSKFPLEDLLAEKAAILF